MVLLLFVHLAPAATLLVGFAYGQLGLLGVVVGLLPQLGQPPDVGLLLQWGHVGLAGVAGLDAFAFAASSYLFLLIQPSKVELPQPKPSGNWTRSLTKDFGNVPFLNQ